VGKSEKGCEAVRGCVTYWNGKSVCERERERKREREIEKWERGGEIEKWERGGDIDIEKGG